MTRAGNISAVLMLPFPAAVVLAALAARAEMSKLISITVDEPEKDIRNEVHMAEERAHEMIIMSSTHGYPMAGDSGLESSDKHPYIIERVLGAGSHGSVYLALHAPSGERFAIKNVRYTDSNSKQPNTRIANELSINAALAGTGIVPELRQVYHAANSGDTYAIMDYVPGLPLFKVVRGIEKAKRNDILPALATLVAPDILLAIAKMQARNIVHNDIQESNIMIALDDAAPLRMYVSVSKGSDDKTSYSPKEMNDREISFPPVVSGQQSLKVKGPISEASLNTILGLVTPSAADNARNRSIPELYVPDERTGFDTIAGGAKDRRAKVMESLDMKVQKLQTEIHRIESTNAKGRSDEALATAVDHSSSERPVQSRFDMEKAFLLKALDTQSSSDSSKSSAELIELVRSTARRQSRDFGSSPMVVSPWAGDRSATRLERDASLSSSSDDLSADMLPRLKVQLIDMGQAVRIKNPRGNQEAKTLLIGNDIEWVCYPYHSSTHDTFRLHDDVIKLGEMLTNLAGHPISSMYRMMGLGEFWGKELIAEYPALVAFVRACLAHKTPSAATLIKKHMAALLAEADLHANKVVGEHSPLHLTLSSSEITTVAGYRTSTSVEDVVGQESSLGIHGLRLQGQMSIKDTMVRYSPRAHNGPQRSVGQDGVLKMSQTYSQSMILNEDDGVFRNRHRGWNTKSLDENASRNFSVSMMRGSRPEKTASPLGLRNSVSDDDPGKKVDGSSRKTVRFAKPSVSQAHHHVQPISLRNRSDYPISISSHISATFRKLESSSKAQPIASSKSNCAHLDPILKTLPDSNDTI